MLLIRIVRMGIVHLHSMHNTDENAVYVFRSHRLKLHNMVTDELSICLAIHIPTTIHAVASLTLCSRHARPAGEIARLQELHRPPPFPPFRLISNTKRTASITSKPPSIEVRGADARDVHMQNPAHNRAVNSLVPPNRSWSERSVVVVDDYPCRIGELRDD